MIGKSAGIKIGVAAEAAVVAVDVPVVGNVCRAGRRAVGELHDAAVIAKAAGRTVVGESGVAGV